MNTQVHPEIQIITDNLDYNTAFEQYLKDRKMMGAGTNYRTVAVIGCQSSGKSTLLNLLFGTKFDVMDSDNGRTQTTKGIWMAINASSNILVFDIEGTDSKERGEQRMTFEQTTSLFALAIADVLLINMWTTDIGRYGASNYGLLKVIFEVNLKLFAQKSSKKLLFVLRDFNERENSFESIKGILEADLNRIWNEIYKPDKFANSKPGDFFNFDYCVLPHKQFEEENFIEQSIKLKARFEVSAKDSVFLNDEQQQNVPIDGMPHYVSQAWQSIREQKELNLPDQRAMVANYRCTELKDEALKLIQQEINDLQIKSQSEVLPNFVDFANQILEKANEYYNSVAKQYDQNVFRKIQKELIQQVLASLFQSFESQLKKLRQTTFTKVDAEIKKLDSKDLSQICDNLNVILTALQQSNFDSFCSKIKAMVIANSGWEQKVQSHKEELNQQLSTLVDNCKQKLMLKLTSQSLKENQLRLKQLINDNLTGLDQNLASNIDDAYRNNINKYNKSLTDVLKSQKGFGLSNDQVYEVLTAQEQQAHKFCEQELKAVFNSQINQGLLRKFNDQFKKDDKGKLHEWKDIDEAVIKQIFDKCKDQTLLMFTQFKTLNFPKNLTLIDAADETTFEVNKYLMQSVATGIRQATLKPGSLTKQRILSEEEINRVRIRYLEEIEVQFEEAIARHRNISTSTIPVWLWAILIWFASDNILGYMASPILYYPFVIISSILVTLWQLELLPLVIEHLVPQFKRQVNNLLAKTPIDIRI